MKGCKIVHRKTCILHIGLLHALTSEVTAKADVRRVLALAPHEIPASFAIRLFRLCSFAALRVRCSLYERVRSKVTPRYTG